MMPVIWLFTNSTEIDAIIIRLFHKQSVIYRWPEGLTEKPADCIIVDLDESGGREIYDSSTEKNVPIIVYSQHTGVLQTACEPTHTFRLLYPLDAAQLIDTLKLALPEFVGASREISYIPPLLEKHRQIIKERFWFELLYGKFPTPTGYEMISQIASEYMVELTGDYEYVVFLIRVFWNENEKPLLSRNDSLLARENIIKYLLLDGYWEIPVISLSSRMIAVIKPLTSGEYNRSETKAACDAYVRFYKQYLHRNVLCIHQGPMSVMELVQRSNRICEEMEQTVIENENEGLGSVVSEIQEYIQAHLDTDISRRALATHVFLNPDYMSRMFKNATEYTITEYIAEQRIACACKLLASETCSISEVASRVGYSNFSYFSTLFKKRTGYTPSEYRNQIPPTGPVSRK